MKNYVTIVLLCLCSFSKAQDSIPVLKGTVNISITKGTIDCDLTLENIPPIGDYLIRINSGMNIRNFRNVANDQLIYFEKENADTLSTGESCAYYFPANGGKGKFLPKAIAFRYVGAYPVIKDTIHDYSVEDWKGNIAFNGYSVRADGRQSAWYPVLYDVKKDLVLENIKYDLQVNCADCNTIYVNGNIPVSGQSAHLTRNKPVQAMIYCGNYKVSNVDGTYFLNPDITDEQIKEFGSMINSYKQYLEKQTGIPYQDKITFVQTTPTSKDNAWMFVTYPSIVNIGFGDYGMKGFFKKDAASFRPYIAHELSHFYFGTYARFNSELGDMISESFAEYMSLKTAQRFVHDSIARQKIQKKIKSMQNFAPVPFAKVHSKNDYHNRELYVYYYAPVIYWAIEKEIGEPAMWKWLRAILDTRTMYTNYAFLEQTLRSALQDDQKTEEIKNKYFVPDNALANAIQTISK